jgi:aminobenzoyl-glutamate transport protein
VIGRCGVLHGRSGHAADRQEAPPEGRLTPFYQSLVAGFFLLFLACRLGLRQGGRHDQQPSRPGEDDVGAMGDLAYYLVLAFAAAHFVAMFAGRTSA